MRPTPAPNLPTTPGAPSTSPKVLANLPTVPGRSLVASPSPVATRGAISATPLPPTEAVEVASSTTEGLGLLAIDERGEYALQSQRDLRRGSFPSCRNDSFSGGAMAVETSYTTFPLK